MEPDEADILKNKNMNEKNFLGEISRQELRDWLEKHHATETECRVIVKKGKPPVNGLWYVDAVEEALCFGWIDSTLKKLDTGETVQKLMPRGKRSHWTELNKERCRRMERLGLMTDAGRVLILDLDAPFVIRHDILEALQQDEKVWKNFCSFPELYQRIRVDNIQGYKDKEQSERRLQKLIDTAREGVMYGEWNDYGQLL